MQPIFVCLLVGAILDLLFDLLELIEQILLSLVLRRILLDALRVLSHLFTTLVKLVPVIHFLN